MKPFKILFLLTLFLLIFGSAGYFGYQLFIKPGRTERMERAVRANASSPSPTPDPGKASFDAIVARQAAGTTPALRDEWTAWVANHSDSPLCPEARRRLGSANMALLFQPAGDSNPALPVYTVVKGDSLAKIASRQHSSAELIQRANQLQGIGLQIGQQLVVPQLKITLEIDRSARTLTILNNGSFLKEYSLMSCPPGSAKTAPITSRILDKTAVSGTKRVAFGDKSYDGAEKALILAQAPAIVSVRSEASAAGSTNAPSSPAVAAPMPGGFVLSTVDLQEIFPLVSRNASVIIH